LQFHWTIEVSDLITLNWCSQLAGAAIVMACVRRRGELGYSRASDRAEAARARQKEKDRYWMLVSSAVGVGPWSR
jgi:hypothetical protein